MILNALIRTMLTVVMLVSFAIGLHGLAKWGRVTRDITPDVADNIIVEMVTDGIKWEAEAEMLGGLCIGLVAGLTAIGLETGRKRE